MSPEKTALRLMARSRRLRRGRRQLVLLSVVVLALAFDPASTVGQNPTSHAPELQSAAERLQPGQRLQLQVDTAASQLEGTFLRVYHAGLVFDDGGQSASVPYAAIQRLSVRETSVGSGPVVGALIGGIAGALVGDLGAQLNCDCGDNTPKGERAKGAVVGGVVAGLIGALVGAAATSESHWTVVFP